MALSLRILFLISDKQCVLPIIFYPRCYDESVHNFCQNISSCVYGETKKFRGFDFGWDSGNLLKCFRFVKRKVFVVKKITAQCQCNNILEGLSNDRFCNSVFLLIYRICCWKVSIDVKYSNTVQYPYCTKICANMQHEMQFSVSNVWDATDIIQLPGGVLVLGKEPTWESSCIVHAFCNLPL